MRCVGRSRPARHVGSVDVFLEAVEAAESRDVPVVDNAGRTDEACVGDPVTLEVGVRGFGRYRHSAPARSRDGAA